MSRATFDWTDTSLILKALGFRHQPSRITLSVITTVLKGIYNIGYMVGNHDGVDAGWTDAMLDFEEDDETEEWATEKMAAHCRSKIKVVK